MNLLVTDLADVLRPATGYKLDVSDASAVPAKGIYLEIVSDEELGDARIRPGYKRRPPARNCNKPGGISTAFKLSASCYLPVLKRTL
ncbi:MAG: hypothetical protein QM762_19660 [Chryseolinea sp.]